MKRQFCRRLAAFAVWAIAAWLAAADSFGVILYRTGDPSANTMEPAGDLAGSGWQFEGQFGAYLGTPIAPQYFITAKHLGSASSVLIFQGGSYTLVAGFNDPNSDLTIWRVLETFPVTAPLYMRDDEVAKPLVVIGRGSQRGAEISLNSTLTGWGWGLFDSQQRWGENTVTQIVPFGPGFGEMLYATFDAGGGFNEAHLSSGDSGGAVFIKDTDEVWKLAGINAEVDGPFYTDGAGNGGFIGALFDSRGLYVTDYSPPPAYELLSGDDPIPSGFFATRISSKLPWIYSVIDPHGDVNSDGTNNLIAYALGLNPGNPNAGQIPRGEADGSYLSLIYTKDTTASDVTYAIEQSTDLDIWSPVTPTNENLGTVGTIQTIKAKVPRGSEPQMFLRLRVTRP